MWLGHEFSKFTMQIIRIVEKNGRCAKFFRIFYVFLEIIRNIKFWKMPVVEKIKERYLLHSFTKSMRNELNRIKSKRFKRLFFNPWYGMAYNFVWRQNNAIDLIGVCNFHIYNEYYGYFTNFLCLCLHR